MQIGIRDTRDWASIGLDEACVPTADWKRYEFTFLASRDCPTRLGIQYPAGKRAAPGGRRLTLAVARAMRASPTIRKDKGCGLNGEAGLIEEALRNHPPSPVSCHGWSDCCWGHRRVCINRLPHLTERSAVGATVADRLIPLDHPEPDHGGLADSRFARPRRQRWLDLPLDRALPTYNEELAIEAVLDEIVAALSGESIRYEILVVDDASTDATAAHGRALRGRLLALPGAGDPLPGEPRAGAARKVGTAAQGELVAMLDADGTYPAECIPNCSHFPAYDQVNGADQRSRARPWLRVPAKWFIRKLACYLTASRSPI